MATRAVSTVVTYKAWDTSANTAKTGDSANHTLKWVKDGTASTTTNAGAEVDATNAPGTYKVTLTATETDCTFGTLAGVSSTANIALFGVEVGFEYVPTAATTFGAFIGNATAALGVDASGRVDLGKILGTAVSSPATAGILDVNVKNMNNVAATSITAVNANQGTTQPINFTGTAGSALAKSDMVDIAGAAVSASTAQIGVNAVNWAGGAIPSPNVTGVPLVDNKYLLGTIYSTPATAGIMDINVKNIKNSTTAGAAGYAGIDWNAINAPTTAQNLSGTQIKSVNNLGVGSASINTVATSGSTLTTGSSVSGTYASTAQLDGTYWQIADTAGTLDMYFEFSVGTTGVPTTALWTGGLTTAVNTLKIYAYNWAGASWDQIGTLSGTTSLIVNELEFDFTTAHVGTGGNIGLVRVRFSNTGLTSANFYTDQILCGYTNVITYPSNFSTLGISAGGHISNVDTLTTYTGNTVQTGDSFARIGVAGVGLTNLGDTRIAHLDADVSSRMATFTLPTNFSSLVIDSTGRVNAFLIGILTSVFTEGATGRVAAAFKQFFNIASPTSTMNEITLVDTITTYTGNTVQTGDSYARIGANGASLTAVGITSNRKKGSGATFEFLMQDASTGAPKTGLTVASTISKDGGAPASTSNSVSEIGLGQYQITLTATEMTANNIFVQFTSSGAVTSNLSIQTQL